MDEVTDAFPWMDGHIVTNNVLKIPGTLMNAMSSQIGLIGLNTNSS